MEFDFSFFEMIPISRIIIKLQEEKDTCGYRGWIGVWDVPDEGNFTDVNTGKEVTFTNWRLNFPDGGTLENCVVQQVSCSCELAIICCYYT